MPGHREAPPPGYPPRARRWKKAFRGHPTGSPPPEPPVRSRPLDLAVPRPGGMARHPFRPRFSSGIIHVPAAIRADPEAADLGRPPAGDRAGQAAGRRVATTPRAGRSPTTATTSAGWPTGRWPGRPCATWSATAASELLGPASGRAMASSRSWSSSSTPTRSSRSRSIPTTTLGRRLVGRQRQDRGLGHPPRRAREPDLRRLATRASRATISPRRCETGEVEPLLHRFEARAGDCILIPAGTVHAIGAGVVLAEIQQMSDATFRVHDWGRARGRRPAPRHSTSAEALESIDFDAGPVAPVVATPEPMAGGTRERLVDCRYFALEREALRARHGGHPRAADPSDRPQRRSGGAARRGPARDRQGADFARRPPSACARSGRTPAGPSILQCFIP